MSGQSSVKTEECLPSFERESPHSGPAFLDLTRGLVTYSTLQAVVVGPALIVPDPLGRMKDWWRLVKCGGVGMREDATGA